MSTPPSEFAGVTVATVANIYFDGGVVSHTLRFPDGTRKTLGLIFPGSYRFETAGPETMEIVRGHCRVTDAAGAAERTFGPGGGFDVPARSAFTIAVAGEICEYICSYG